MTKLKQAASVIAVLGSLGLLLSSSCGGDSPAAIADNTAGASGSAGNLGAGGGADGATAATGGGAGSSDDASVGSGGSGVDTDATFFADGMVEIPEGAVQVGDSSLDDDAGDPPLEDAGNTLGDGGVIVKKYGILCSAPGVVIRKACTGPVTSCCYDSDAPSGSCSSLRCASGAGTYTCDGPEDCDAGEVCCGSISTLPILKTAPHHEYSTNCSRSCGKGLVLTNTAYVVVCKKATDCAITQTCAGPATNMPGGLGICTTVRLL